MTMIILIIASTISVGCKKDSVSSGGNNGGSTQPGEVQYLPYTQSFETEFGTYTTKNVIGEQEWEINYSAAAMAGYVNNGGNYEYYVNEDWLISSPVAIDGVQHAKMVVYYIGRHFIDINEDVTFWASTDYNYGDMPSTASWTQIPANLEGGHNWEDYYTAEMNLDDFIGQTVTIAVKYVSDDVYPGKISIRSISIEEGEVSGGGQGGEVQSLPYLQDFSNDFGTYITKDVLGSQCWTIDYSTAKMTGYVSGSCYENEDWLISSPVSIMGVQHANMVMTYIGRYLDDGDVTIWVSTNYNYGDMPSEATWSQLPVILEQGVNWTYFYTAELSLDDYIGQTVTVAVKYTSTDTKAGTIEVKSIAIQ